MTTVDSPTAYGKAVDLGFDTAGGPWVAVCNKHSAVVNVASRDKARAAAKDTAQFCDDCRDMNQEAPIVTFSASQTKEVAPEAFEELNDKLVKAHEEWLAEERAKQQPDEQPALGVFMSGDIAHRAVAIENKDGMLVPYMRTACKPDAVVMAGEQTDESDPAMCPLCKAGVEEPATKTTSRRGRWSTQPKAPKTEPAPPVAAQHENLTDALSSATVKLLTALSDDPNPTDARVAVDILLPALNSLKGLVPRRRVGRTTGARSGLVKQSATVNPSDELEQVKTYAEQGDKRAKDILEHVNAYVPDVDCSYCLQKSGRSTRHGYATAFMSVGRELRAMSVRAQNRD